MINPQFLLQRNIKESVEAKQEFMKDECQLKAFESAAHAVVKCYLSGGRLYIAGNGGSAADAQHLAAEFVSKLARDRDPMPAEALTVDTSVLTAIGNDYGFEKIFSRQIIAKVGSNDVFLGLTTSGNSKNIIEALRACKEKNAQSIVFTGKDGGDVVNYADFSIVSKGNKTSVIQETHITLAHALCEYVENVIFNTINKEDKYEC